MYEIELLNTSSLSVIIFSYRFFFQLFTRVIGASKISAMYLPNYMFVHFIVIPCSRPGYIKIKPTIGTSVFLL